MYLRDDFVEISGDEFEGKRHVTHRRPLKIEGRDSLSLVFRRVKAKRLDAICLDWEIKSSISWTPSNIIFVIDGRRHKEKMHIYDRGHWVGGERPYKREGHLSVSNSLITQICASKSLKIKIEGSSGNNVVLNEETGAQLRLQAQQFYNNVYDKDAYLESTSVKSPKLEADETENRLAIRNQKIKELRERRNNVGSGWGIATAILAFFTAMASKGNEGLLLLTISCGVIGLCWFLPIQSKLSRLEDEERSECKKCHKPTISHVDTNIEMIAVRSVEKIVANRMTGQNESRQVTVTDQKVTEHYQCTSCKYQWSEWYTRTVD